MQPPTTTGDPAASSHPSPAPLALGLVIAAAVLLPLFLGEGGLLTAAVVLVGVSAAALLAPLSAGLSLVFLAALLGLCVAMSEWPVHVMGIRMYGADFALYFLAIAAYYWFHYPEHNRFLNFGERRPGFEPVLITLLLTLAAYGMVSLALGFLEGHAPRNILGDYRRLYFYPLAMLIPLMLPLAKGHVSGIRAAILTGGALVVLTGLYRLATGQTWHEDYYGQIVVGPIQLRLLSQFEIATLGLVLGLSTAQFRVSRSWTRALGAMAIGCLALVFLIISGWRLGLLYILGAPIAALFFLSYARGERIRGFFIAPLLLAVLGLVGTGIAFWAFPGEARDTLRTIQERTFERGFQEDQRYYAWGRSLELFAGDPILGMGIGNQLEFFQMTSSGQLQWNQSTAHSVYFDILYQSGLIGIILFLLFHGLFVLHVLRQSRQLSPALQGLAAGLMAGYVCIMAVIGLQPLQTGAAVTLYLLMGFILFLTRYSSDTAQSPTSPTAAQP